MPADDTRPNKSPFTPLNLLVAAALILGALFYIKPTLESNDSLSPPLFTLAGQAYHAKDLPLKYAQPLYQSELEHYQIRKQIVTAAAIQAYIEQQVISSGEDRKTVIQRLLDLQTPTQNQIETYYQQNRARIQAPLDQVREQIGMMLFAREQHQKQTELAEKLISLNELELRLRQPTAPFGQLATDGYPSKGVADATVTLVEFADYQCPHCKQAHQLSKQILAPYLDRIRYVYMDFPINRSGISRKIAEGAVCADEQQKFWQYQDMAFQSQATLSDQSPIDFAQQLKLDLTAFSTCYESNATKNKVKRSEQQAIEAGVTGTPSFFINGKKLLLNDFATDLKKEIDAALGSNAPE